MYFLTKDLWFPPLSAASAEGIVALGGDLSPERLLLAYQSGIFPWFESDDDIILWWSPDPRMVLFPEELKISKSLRAELRKNRFQVTFDRAFDRVINACASIRRSGQSGTWITDDMKQAYAELHRQGKARSVEVWENDELVGGLYGVDLGNVYCGESMFSKVSNASKVGFVHLVEHLRSLNYTLIDCQVYTDHLSRLGAREIRRKEFIEHLRD
ncbi:leucyl/phenylalanyl-tRNA--protein transferase [Robertkochia aurantiaca]|uniref:leucyl/phenylalanyl-tRNA--protein transferase n=1 Tax=Robertkochia aurantiaca TaxID=2873700 RepID=UPI001CCF0CA5|nr:leucyl/phenylalanyl-tRNA--protein transferase [Robertkochia sp. 3YJGBD-33]